MLARVFRSFARSATLGGRATFTINTGKEDGGNPVEDAGIDHPTGEQPKGVEFPGEHGSAGEQSGQSSDQGYGQNNRPYGQRYSRNNYNRYQSQEGEEQQGDNQRSFQRRDSRGGEFGDYQRGYQRREGGYRSNWRDERRPHDQQGGGQRYNNYGQENRYPRRDYDNNGEQREVQGYGEQREDQSYGERRGGQGYGYRREGQGYGYRRDGQGYGDRREGQNRYDRRQNSNWVDRNAATQEKPDHETEATEHKENPRGQSSEGSATPKF